MAIKNMNVDDDKATQGGYRFSMREVPTYESGEAIAVKVEVKSTTHSEEIEVGGRYDILFKFDTKSASFSNRDLRAIMAAVYGGDPKDTKVKLQPKVNECIEAGDDLELAEKEFLCVQSSRTGKNGESYVNALYQPAR
jgi:hypothetical protein